MELDAIRAEKVFVANFQEKHKFHSAEKFGELIFITHGFIDLRKLPIFQKKYEAYLLQAAPTDFVILNGPSVINTLMVMMWFRRFGYVNVLTWDNRTETYIHHVVSVSGDFLQAIASPK